MTTARPSTDSADLQRIDRRAVCKGILGIATSAVLVPGCARAGADLVAETTSGKIRGSRDGSIIVFKGVPYGGNTAKTRFMHANSPDPWAGVRDAVAYGPMAPQPPRSHAGARALLRSWEIPQRMDEDCLALNVWTPGLRPRRKRPVMVWIHGGGFFAGSGATNAYDGTRLALRGEVVVVTVNHRLNIFGYLYLGGSVQDERYADSGNIGQYDLIMALRWIRDNIEEFGGDPHNVMLFGESGGGQKICCLLAMQQAQGLFHRAAVQSGPYTRAVNREAAQETAAAALRLLNIKTDRLDGLAELTTDQISRAYRKLPPGMMMGMGPVVDGRGLSRNPFAPQAPAVSLKVPLLIGITRTETTYIFDDDRNFSLSWAELPERLGGFVGDSNVARIIAEYRGLLPAAQPSEIFFDITTQIVMGRASALIAERKSAQKQAPVYFYQLSWNTPVDQGKWRSPHTLDVPLVFDNVALVPSMFGGASSEAHQIADSMSEAWLAFARTGNPNTRTLIDWPAYDAQRRGVMDFNLTSAMLEDPFGQKLRVLSTVPDWDGREGI